MELALTTELLLQTVGKSVKNKENNYIGEIIEVIRNSSNNIIEYIILKSDQLFDNEERFFAIPACPKLITISKMGEVIVLTSLQDLHIANSVRTVDECPSPDFHNNPLIFELFEYKGLHNKPRTVKSMAGSIWTEERMKKPIQRKKRPLKTKRITRLKTDQI